MKHLAGSSLALVLLVSGCGATDTSEREGSASKGATEATVNFVPPVLIERVLEMCRERGVRLTQAVSRMPVGGESRSTGVMVYPGMSDRDVVNRFHEAGLRTPAILVQQIYISGDADALKAFESEPNVEIVFLKPDKPYGS